MILIVIKIIVNMNQICLIKIWITIRIPAEQATICTIVPFMLSCNIISLSFLEFMATFKKEHRAKEHRTISSNPLIIRWKLYSIVKVITKNVT